MEVKIIEFAGRAGAGKTFIAKKLRDELEEAKDINCLYLSIRKRRKISLTISIISFKIFFLSIFLSFKLKAQSLNGFIFCLRRIYTILRRYKFYSKIAHETKNNKDKLLILEDEGIAQKSRAISRKSNSNYYQIVKVLYKHINIENILFIFVRAQAKIIKKRLLNRDNKKIKVSKNSITKGVKGLKNLSSKFNELEFLLVDNNENVDPIIKKIKQKLV